MAKISGKAKGSGCCAQLTGQFSHRGNDVRNLVVQVYGCWEWHGVPPFIVDLLRTYKSPQAAGTRCTIAGYEGDVREAQTGRQNGFDERLRLRFREWCVDRGVTGPHYEYPCSDCSKKFTMVLTLAEREKGCVKCRKVREHESRTAVGCILRDDPQEELSCTSVEPEAF
jgi:hypothetical protein